jgi:hypothetical protein
VNAGNVVKAYLLYLLLGTVLLLLADGWLWVNGRPTVSAWLRLHRQWYDYTLAVALALNSLLFIHLFRGPMNDPR